MPKAYDPFKDELLIYGPDEGAAAALVTKTPECPGSTGKKTEELGSVWRKL